MAAEKGRRAKRRVCESAAAELGEREDGRFVDRRGSDFDHERGGSPCPGLSTNVTPERDSAFGSKLRVISTSQQNGPTGSLTR